MLKDIDDSSKHFKGMSELLKKAGYDPSSKILNTMTRKAGYKFSKISMYQKIRRFFRCFDFVSEMNSLYLLKILIFYMTVSLILKIFDFQIYSLYDLFRTNNIKIQDISHAFLQQKFITRTHVFLIWK
mgnify:CR=1 FL=1